MRVSRVPAMGRRITRWAVLVAGVSVALPASSRDSRAPDDDERPIDRSLSVGSPTDGRLVRGVALTPSEHLLLKSPQARWALPHLVGMITRSAERVAAAHPDTAKLAVGDLSARKGGPLPGHASHRSGRDADVGFYYLDESGHSQRPARFLPVRWDGRTADRELRFDTARNWSMVQAWLRDPVARPQHIFVADWLRRRLLDHARREGVRLRTIHRAAIVLKQPSSGPVHDDHFHVRIDCPRDQRGICIRHPRPPKHSSDER